MEVPPDLAGDQAASVARWVADGESYAGQSRATAGRPASRTMPTRCSPTRWTEVP